MNRCPTEEEVARYCLSSELPDSSTSSVGRHLAGCSSCRQQVDELRSAASLLRSGASVPPEDESQCLDDLTISALAEGTLETTAREPAFEHLLTCDACRQRVGDVSRLLRDAAVAAEVRKVEATPAESGRGSRWIRFAGGLAAAAVLVVLVRSVRSPGVPVLVHREEPITLISAPIPLAPIGMVARVDSLSWRSVPRATQYRVTLFTQEGMTAWGSGTVDTVVVLPDTVKLVPGAYYWKVEARTDWNRWTASEMVEIRIRGRR